MDLVWILLKTKGVDPTNHPVMQELERVKSYFGKIKRVQDNEKEPAEQQKRMKVDRSAAGRFMRAALAGEPGSTPAKHTKFEDESANKKEGQKTHGEATPSKKEAAAATGTPSSNKKKRPAVDRFEGYDKPKTPNTAPASPAKKKDSAAASPSKKQKKKSAK